MTATTSAATSSPVWAGAAAERLGRPLTKGETRIDLARLDRAMEAAKDELERELRRERRRAVRLYLASGRPLRLRRTDAIVRILRDLYELGVDSARAEIRDGGYDPDELPERSFAVSLPVTLEPLGEALDLRLAELGRVANAKVLTTDLSALANAEILAAFDRVPGVRAAAADLVSTPLLRGQGDVWDQADAAGIVETWVYSAIMDSATCESCGYLDGTTYDSWESIQAVLPGGGPNPRCFGGMRCRCRAVPELFDPGEPSGYPEAPTVPPSLLGRPAVDVRAPAPVPTVAELVPGPSYETRAALTNKRISSIREIARLRGVEPEALFAELEEAIARTTAESRVQIRIRPGALAQVLDDGRFKSQFETNTSGGALDQNLRARAEEKMFGYERELDPASRPIYGYLSGANELSVNGYGEIRVVLRDDVRARTTFVLDDSLGPGAFGETIPAPVEAPNSLAMNWGGYRQFSVDLDLRQARLNDISGIYPEAQIHGGVAVTDIEEVVLPGWQPSNVWQIDYDRAIAEERFDDALVIRRKYLTDPYESLRARLDELGIRWRYDED